MICEGDPTWRMPRTAPRSVGSSQRTSNTKPLLTMVTSVLPRTSACLDETLAAPTCRASHEKWWTDRTELEGRVVRYLKNPSCWGAQMCAVRSEGCAAIPSSDMSKSRTEPTRRTTRVFHVEPCRSASTRGRVRRAGAVFFSREAPERANGSVELKRTDAPA
jgi:hypothetical protein